MRAKAKRENFFLKAKSYICERGRSKKSAFYFDRAMQIYEAESSYKLKAGFTLVEMIIAFGVFAVVMVIAVGSLISLVEANHKAQTLKTVVNNLHFALENMSRNIRTGSRYHCGSGSILVPTDCPTTPKSELVFRARDGSYLIYELVSGAIMRSKSDDGGVLLDPGNFIPITAPEITVDTLNFYVSGAEEDEKGKGNQEQPRVLLVVKGSMKGKSKVISRFDIQTLISQRSLDI